MKAHPHVRYLGRLPGSQLQHEPILADTAIWGVNQCMGDLYLPFKRVNKFLKKKKKCTLFLVCGRQRATPDWFTPQVSTTIRTVPGSSWELGKAVQLSVGLAETQFMMLSKGSQEMELGSSAGVPVRIQTCPHSVGCVCVLLNSCCFKLRLNYLENVINKKTELALGCLFFGFFLSCDSFSHVYSPNY